MLEPKPQPQRIRLRAILIGIALIPLAGLWIFGGEMGGAVPRYTFATWAAPFYNAIYILLILSLINLQLRKRLPKLALNGLELLAIYAMVSVGSALMSTDMQGILITIIGYPTYFADSTNNWAQLFNSAVPKWLIVTDKAALVGFYKGRSDFFLPENYRAWIQPIIWWTLFIWALMMMMMCVNTILRKAWVERERLTFPIVALPMAMTEEPESFFANRLMWIGFAIAGAITLVNGLSVLYPNVPYIAIKRVDYQIATSGPFAAMGSVRVAFYFFAIALGFLMPVDLSFSIYFFYILFKLESVATYMLGTPPESGFPYQTSQAWGAYMAIFCMAVWGLRGHLKEVWRIAMGRGEPGADAGEPLKYRSAIIWFAISSLFLIFFAKLAGMRSEIAILFFVIYIALMVMITRIRAELGFPVHDMHGMGPDATMTRLVAANEFDRQTLGVFSLFFWFNRVYRSHPMPHQLEGLKSAGADGGARKSMFSAILIAGMVAAPVCFIIYLNGFYHYGAATAHMNQWATGFGRESFERLQNWFVSPKMQVPGERIATVFGFALALGLTALRQNVVGFPLHPLAYAVANSWGVANLWLPIMVGSWAKAAVLKGAGLQGYRKAMMIAFGLMLGEFAVGCTWTLYGLIRGIPTYDFWP